MPGARPEAFHLGGYNFRGRERGGNLLAVPSTQDKVLVMVISNYVLWPLANSLNAHLVPEEHRKVAGHIITVREGLSCSACVSCQYACVERWCGLLLALTGPGACRSSGMRGSRRC